MACHDDINPLPLYFCVLCGETFLTNEEFAIHTTDYEESQYPCTSCDEYFRTSTDLTDHIYTDHENNLDITIPPELTFPIFKSGKSGPGKCLPGALKDLP